MKNRWIAGLAALFVLIGCAPSGKTITYWSHDNAQFVAANKALIAAFEKENPGIRVKYESFPYDTFLQKVQAAVSAGNPPDVMQVFGSWVPGYIKVGAVAPVPNLTPPQAKERFFDPALGSYIAGDKVYGVPREFNIESGGILYWPDALAQAGFSTFPKTWDDLRRASKALAQHDASGNLTRPGFDFSNTDSVPYLFLQLILQQGGHYWAPDGGAVTFRTPEAKKALQLMVDMVQTDKTTDFVHVPSGSDPYQLLFQKVGTMAIRGPWVIASALPDFGASGFATAPTPSFAPDGNLAFAAEAGWGEIVSSKSQNPEVAFQFLDFITSTANNANWNAGTNTIPAERSVAVTFGKDRPLLSPWLQILPQGVPIGDVGNVDTFKIEVVFPAIQRACEGKLTVDEALAQIEDATNQLIRNSK